MTALSPADDDIPARPGSRDADELLVRRAIAAALSVPVRRRDTGSGEAVHDLEICYPDGRLGAVEVVSTRDRRAEMLTHAVVQRGHVAVRRLRRSWLVVVPPTTRLRDVEGDLPGFLATLEAAGIKRVRRGEWGRWRREMNRLGLQTCTSNEPSPTAGPGYRFLSAPRGAFEQQINKAVERCEHFLSEPAQRDVIDKLRRADASERHAAVVVNETWLDVFDQIRQGTTLPTAAPSLPDDIDGLWILALWGGPTRGVFWINSSWADVLVEEWRPASWTVESRMGGNA
jgi:hypothetical protein